MSTVPSLEFGYPDCSVCDRETWHDGDNLRCDDCGIYWRDGGEFGGYLTSGQQCASVIEWFNRPDLAAAHENIRHQQERCSLPWPHDGKRHRYDSLTSWESDDPRVVDGLFAPLSRTANAYKENA
jgi:hypothetical protein